MFKFTFIPTETVDAQKALTLSQTAKTQIGMFLVGQVKARFRNQGGPGQPWPQKKTKSWGYDDGRSILTGRTARLKSSFSFEIKGDRITVFSDVKYAWVQQNGMKIKPKNAKALFIPITDRAANSVLMPYKSPTGTTYGKRVATTGRKLKSGERAGLIPGRLHDGRLQKKDSSGKWVDGTPDFIFLRQVTIPARPMLPDSTIEQAEQAEFIAAEFESLIKEAA